MERTSQMPDTKEGFIEIYKSAIEREKRGSFLENYYNTKNKIKELLDIGMFSKSPLSSDDKTNLRNEFKQFKDKFDNLLKNINPIEQKTILEQVMEIVAKYDKDFKPFNKDFEHHSITSMIGEYFLIEQQGLYADLKKFQDSPQEFFNIINEIEDKEIEQSYEQIRGRYL